MTLKMKTIIFVVALWACSACQAAEYFSERYLVDIDRPDIKPDQRIVSFKITLFGAKFDSMDPIPAGWSLTIKNESNGVASMEGEIDVGMAAIDVREFVKAVSLRKYLVHEKEFTIAVELVLLGGAKESDDKEVKLDMKQVRLVKAKP